MRSHLCERLRAEVDRFWRDVEFCAWAGGYYTNNELYRVNLRATARLRYDTQRGR